MEEKKMNKDFVDDNIDWVEQRIIDEESKFKGKLNWYRIASVKILSSLEDKYNLNEVLRDE